MSGHTSLEPSRSPRWGRATALALGWIKVTLLSIAVLLGLAMSLGSGQDPAGRGMAGGFAFVAMLYLLVLVVPALILAYRADG